MLINTSEAEFLSLRKKTLEKVFSRMNSRQKEAVFTVSGPLLILAGAGSGKTTVVVNRIANLIRFGKAYGSDFIPPEVTEDDVNNMKAYIDGSSELSEDTERAIAVSACQPWKIMAITFTNKAAGELKERLALMLGEERGNDIWASTFHSSCAKILRKYGDRLGYSNHFTIYDTDDSKRLMKDCMKQLDISEKIFPIRSVLTDISHAKDSLIDYNEYMRDAGEDFRLKSIARCYQLYQLKLKDADAMDFDDLIFNTVKLFEQHSDVLEYYQNRFSYLMVDEYQDTNIAQYKLIKLLADARKNICVVGDDDQSIYKFRGATIENILSFEKNFPGAKTIRLEQNYRSTQNILDAANAIIDNNTERKGKNLWTDNGQGEKIVVHTATNEQDEADKIADEILKLIAEGYHYSDIAILYRMNSQSLSFERMFAKQGIPHRILGGLRFYERAEIKDMLAYLSVINNHEDEIRLRRIINVPRRGIGDKTIDNAVEIAQVLGEPLYDVLKNAENYPALSRAKQKLKEFTDIIDECTQKLESGESSINGIYNLLLEKTGYVAYLKASDPERAEEKIENIKEFSSNIVSYEEDGGVLTDFLEEISLISDIDNYDNASDTVVLMTVHSAKGLEFPVVFLPGWEENIFPGISAVYNPSETEEERRLAYVAVTRAKKKLYIYNAEQRLIFGSTQRNRISRFADEIPSDLIDRKYSRSFSHVIGSSYTPSYQSKTWTDKSNATDSKKKSSVPAKADVNIDSFNPGDTVMHKTFGQGIILSISPMGNDVLIEVAFEKVGTKKLFAKFAKLTKV